MVLGEEDFRPLAEVAVRVGVNLQPGQTLILQAPAAHAAAARAVAKAAYAAGAKRVLTLFGDELLDRVTLEMAPEEGLKAFPKWLAEGFLQEGEAGAAFLSIIGGDPEVMRGIPPERLVMTRRAAQEAMKPFQMLTMSHRVAWSLIAAPSPAWARQVFPNLPQEESEKALWQAILRTSRADGPDPVGAWHAHMRELQARKARLNDLGIERLHYRAPGTDLTIRLPKTYQWVASGQKRAVGYPTAPNIPTEECFTLPQRDGVDGTVRSTKPLFFAGQRIDGIALRFEQGRIVEFSAVDGEDALRQVIETDEGSHYLGEVALVPVDSPIAQSGILFHNTLFDENASCHLAIGAAYPTCLTDGDEVRSDEDLLAKGGNASFAHVDFMVGSAQLDIDATTRTGTVVPIFRGGKWALPQGALRPQSTPAGGRNPGSAPRKRSPAAPRALRRRPLPPCARRRSCRRHTRRGAGRSAATRASRG